MHDVSILIDSFAVRDAKGLAEKLVDNRRGVDKFRAFKLESEMPGRKLMFGARVFLSPKWEIRPVEF